MNQKTLSRDAEPLEGVGVHSGAPTRILCRPAPPNSGLRFRYAGGGNDATLRADLSAVTPDENLRRTVLRHPEGWTIQTPEHLLSACVGLGITNLEIEVSGSEEVPILDGSAKPYAETLQKAGLEEQRGAQAGVWTVREPLFFRHGDAEITALPSDSLLTVACFLDFPGTVLGNQSVVIQLDPDTFLRHVAPARTFVLESDVAALRAAGLIRGGSLDIAVVVGREAYLNSDLRFPDECARHKVIDLLGDLALVGGLPRGHFMTFRAGHISHLAFGHFLRKENRLRWIRPPNP